MSDTDLGILLATLEPVLRPGELVFCSLEGEDDSGEAPADVFATITEDEGLTVVLPRASADAHGFYYDGVFRSIALRVESSLHAVGLTAAVAGRLAALGIPANVLAAYHHDHVLVPAERAEEAVAALRRLSFEHRA